MRLSQLFESSKNLETVSDLVKLIKAKCQPYLASNLGSLVNGDFFARASRDASRDFDVNEAKFGVLQVRKDRKPLDTPKTLHDAFDEFFNSQFGIKFRSQSAFATKSLEYTDYMLESYGEPLVFIPIGEYTVCYSPVISDLYADIFYEHIKTNKAIFNAMKNALNELVMNDSEVEKLTKQIFFTNTAFVNKLAELVYNTNISTHYSGNLSSLSYITTTVVEAKLVMKKSKVSEDDTNVKRLLELTGHESLDEFFNSTELETILKHAIFWGTRDKPKGYNESKKIILQKMLPFLRFKVVKNPSFDQLNTKNELSELMFHCDEYILIDPSIIKKVVKELTNET
jgi:hypothetical protein